MTPVKCIIVDDEPVAREVLEQHLAKIERVEVVASCKNALEAFEAVNARQVDLVFLDINMPEISGLSFARSMSPDLKVIFTTAYREYAVDGFDLKAVDYLLKPISFERLLQAIQSYVDLVPQGISAFQETSRHEKPEAMFVRADRKMVKVCFDEIIYIESVGDYIRIHLQGKATLVTRESMANIEARLPREDFIRTHRSYLASVHKIDSYTHDTLALGKHEIPISRGYREAILLRLDS